MRRLLTLLPFLTILCLDAARAQDVELLPPPLLDAAKVEATMAKAVDGFIRPGYAALHLATGALDDQMKALCSHPAPETLAAAKARFAEVVGAWSRIEIVRVGPVIEKNRFERILYYPDKKGLGLKQVQRYLTEEDGSVTTVAGLRTKSVAAQGLGALEYMLFGTGADDLLTKPAGFRCRYGAAIAGNLAEISADLSAQWEKPGAAAINWTKPGPQNPVFRDEREALVALLGILVHSAEAIRDQRLETFYKGPDKAKFPRLALYWRSGLTWASLGANIAAVNDLLHISGMQDLLPRDQRSIIGSIDFIAKSMIRVSASIDPDIDKALADDKSRSKVDYLLVNGKDLIFRLNDQYGGAIGLSSGFSFADGD